MSSPTAGTPSKPVVRPPLPHELPRALYLFRNARLRADCRLLVAERLQPIPRFIGAAAWWQEGAVGRFHVACRSGNPDREAMTCLIAGVISVARDAGMEIIQYSELLPDESAWLGLLGAQGFKRLRSERFFEIAYRNAWKRTMLLYERHRAEIPSTWRTEPIRNYGPEEVMELALPHRLLPPEDVRHYWQATTPGGFDLELSCILFDEERPFGTFLVRRMGEGLFIDVQIVKEPNPRRRSLGDLCLLYHDASRVPADGPIQWIRFRSGENEHRQTANLAVRMGGRELPRRHVYARDLRA